MLQAQSIHLALGRTAAMSSVVVSFRSDSLGLDQAVAVSLRVRLYTSRLLRDQVAAASLEVHLQVSRLGLGRTSATSSKATTLVKYLELSTVAEAVNTVLRSCPMGGKLSPARHDLGR